MPVVVGNRTYELNYIINQRRFHEMLKPKILGTMAIVEDALNNAGLGPKDINNIVTILHFVLKTDGINFSFLWEDRLVFH